MTVKSGRTRKGVKDRYEDTTPPDPEPTARDPLYWPYPPDSMWNMPIGDDAVLTDLGFEYTDGSSNNQGRICILEENVLFLNPDAPLGPIMEHNAGWTGASRCGSRTGDVLNGNNSVPDSYMESMPIQGGWQTDPYIGTNPNMSGAFVYRATTSSTALNNSGTDIRLLETQPLHMCPDGVPVSQSINHTYVGDSIITGGKGPPAARTGQSFDNPSNLASWGQGGSHGGSRITAFGGTIRLGEMLPGGEIPHAVKITIDTGVYCAPQSNQEDCYRWPALVADSGAVTNYGSLHPDPGSLPPGAQMGMLLTTPASFNTETLETEPGKILARAVKRYGAYVCDGDFNATVPYICQWQCERSNEGSFDEEFYGEYGYRFFHKNAVHGTPSAGHLAWRRDVGKIVRAFHIVDDNAVNNVGGAGSTRRWTMAPALA